MQDTAKVEVTAYVGSDAQVSGNALVSGNAQVSGNARVSGDAEVYGNAEVSGNFWETSPLYLQGTRHALTNSSHGHITVGCHTHSFKEWKRHYKAIGRANGYTKAEIEEYGRHLAYIIRNGR